MSRPRDSRRIVIEEVTPQLDCGHYPVKREEGDTLAVEADVFRDGHQVIRAALRYRPRGERGWREAPMEHFDNDRWRGVTAPLDRVGEWQYTVVAWSDRFASHRRDVRAKLNAGQGVSVELEEASLLAREAADKTRESDRQALAGFARRLAGPDGADAVFDAGLAALMERYLPRADLTRFKRLLPLRVDRVKARFASWYELFPRSAANHPARHGTFDDVIARLPYVEELGFDTLYLTPIHPIGETQRKGKDNSLEPEPGDPGSPYAIGSHQGGHKHVHPQLGTLADFRRLVTEAAKHGLEVALDFAIQVSPDHPYVKSHPEWFFHRPDGSIKYAENPPKKYQDIYPLNFYGDSWQSQWLEWKSVFDFWIEQGVKTFRVDNPHTKPLQFWQWCIREVQREYPGTIFLSEAFTRPKVMRALAKAGFTQSYTYFTWRNEKWELTEYFEELTGGEMKEYFRGMLFPSTPDILPPFLQNSPPSAFKIRAALAATLSPLWGVYCGFELCENESHSEREEYRSNEKYQLKQRDWDRRGNIKEWIRELNRIRREQPALQEYDNLSFHPCDDDRVLFYGKWLDDHALFMAVSLDPESPRETVLDFPTGELGVAGDGYYQIEELLGGKRSRWRGALQRLKLEPESPARIYRISKR